MNTGNTDLTYDVNQNKIWIHTSDCYLDEIMKTEVTLDWRNVLSECQEAIGQ